MEELPFAGMVQVTSSIQPTSTPTSTFEVKTSSMIVPQPTASVSSDSRRDTYVPSTMTTTMIGSAVISLATASETEPTSTSTAVPVSEPNTAVQVSETSTAVSESKPSTTVNGSAADPLPTASVEADRKGDEQNTPSSLLSLESLVGVAVGGALVLCTFPLCILLAVYCTRKMTREHNYGVSSSSFQGGVVISNLQEKSSSEMQPIEASTRLQQLEVRMKHIIPMHCTFQRR